MVKRVLLLALLLSATLGLYAQNSSLMRKTYIIEGEDVSASMQIDTTYFLPQLLDTLIVDRLNELLVERDCETLEMRRVLSQVAAEQATYMALTSGGEKLGTTVGDRMKSYGGSQSVAELTQKINVVKSKELLTYFKAADEIVFRWMTNSKNVALLESVNYQYIGVSSQLDETKKRIFVSVVVGNYRSFNEGAYNRDQLSVPYSTKNFGLEDYDAEDCRRVNRATNLNELYDGLVIEDNQIYIQLPEEKALQRVLRNKTDGLAIDILQEEQYKCGQPNTIDYNRFNRGVITKPITAKKLSKSNLYVSNNKSKAFKASLGIWPENVKQEGTEINLLIIQDGAVCASVPKSFVVPIKGTFVDRARLLADTVTINTHFRYRPVPDTAEFTFRISFEGRKSTYNMADIRPFLDTLNAPAFRILTTKITAYSSVEGTDEINRRLQQQRAQSIVNALAAQQTDSIVSEIVTDYNRDDFARDIQGTKYKNLASLSVERIQDSIRKLALARELESMLQNHRYAQIDMRVVYDIEGENEQPFVVSQFNKAADSLDYIMALSIQKFIMRRIMHQQYSPDVINELRVPNHFSFCGIAMNNLWLKHHYKMIDDIQLKCAVDSLVDLCPENEYIMFNSLLLNIEHPTQSFVSTAQTLQSKVDRLYYTSLQKETIDRLNLKLQMAVIAAYDSLPVSKSPSVNKANQTSKKNCVERIKKIANPKYESIENSIKFAEIFMNNGEYQLAIKFLEPWINNATTNIDMLLTYVSLCSRFENMMHTQAFTTAMLRIKELDEKKFYNLIDSKNSFSLRVLENENVKSAYCSSCNEDKELKDEPVGEPEIISQTANSEVDSQDETNETVK